MNKTFTVFHAKIPNFGVTQKDNPNFCELHYVEVAKVQCNTLNEVYSLTNHIGKDWTTNKEIISCNAKCRSTSCGDVIVDDKTGEQYMVLGVGFGKLTYIENENPLKRFNNGWLFKSFTE